MIYEIIAPGYSYADHERTVGYIVANSRSTACRHLYKRYPKVEGQYYSYTLRLTCRAFVEVRAAELEELLGEMRTVLEDEEYRGG
tara:strand:+ start:2167 stop:2421 length:255 start_codon:yes stop_codon:yes gene_type:complete